MIKENGREGMPGFVRSDLGAVNRLMTEHNMAATARDAILMALLAGTDMQYYDFPHDVFQNAIIGMVADGSLPLAALDRAVERVLRVKFLLGLFERPYADPALRRSRVRRTKHLNMALDVAREGIRSLAGGAEVVYARGVNFTEEMLDYIPQDV